MKHDGTRVWKALSSTPAFAAIREAIGSISPLQGVDGISLGIEPMLEPCDLGRDGSSYIRLFHSTRGDIKLNGLGGFATLSLYALDDGYPVTIEMYEDGPVVSAGDPARVLSMMIEYAGQPFFAEPAPEYVEIARQSLLVAEAFRRLSESPVPGVRVAHGWATGPGMLCFPLPEGIEATLTMRFAQERTTSCQATHVFYRQGRRGTTSFFIGDMPRVTSPAIDIPGDVSNILSPRRTEATQ